MKVKPDHNLGQLNPELDPHNRDQAIDVAHPHNFQRLADNLPQLIWAACSNGRFNYSNRSLRRYVGEHAATGEFRDWMDCLYADDKDAVLQSWKNSLQTGETFRAEFRLVRASDGEACWFLGRATPDRDGDGNVLAWYGTCTDIHDQKRVEEKLQKAKEQSDQNGRVKDEFLSILSHELRTPLSAILGWTQLLEMGALDANEQIEAVQIIKQQAKVQSQLIEDLLEVSRIVNGKFHMRRQHVELGAVVNAAMSTVRTLADAKQVVVRYDVNDSSVLVEGDPQRLQQLMWNLLCNAIKFSQAGGEVIIQLDRINSGARLVIADKGRGIPPDQIKTIFDRFKQLDSSATRAHGGLGLGLTIAQHIVESHGGEIFATSPGLNEGSTFTVLLPILAVQPPDPMSPAQIVQNDGTPTLQGIDILVVDDEDSARTVVAACLRKFGANVQTASDVREACKFLDELPYHILISDISMPIESGFDMIRCVREAKSPYEKMPAIALTGYASVDDQSRALAAGFNIHVTKPVDQIELVRQVLSLTQNASRS